MSKFVCCTANVYFLLCKRIFVPFSLALCNRIYAYFCSHFFRIGYFSAALVFVAKQTPSSDAKWKVQHDLIYLLDLSKTTRFHSYTFFSLGYFFSLLYFMPDLSLVRFRCFCCFFCCCCCCWIGFKYSHGMGWKISQRNLFERNKISSASKNVFTIVQIIAYYAKYPLKREGRWCVCSTFYIPK